MLENYLLSRRILSLVFAAGTLSQFILVGAVSACKRDPGIKIPEALIQASGDITIKTNGASAEQESNNGKTPPVPSTPAPTSPPVTQPAVPPAASIPSTTMPPAPSPSSTPSTVPSTPSTGSALVVPSGQYFVRNASSLRCFSIPNASLAKEIEFQLADCTVQNGQIFRFDNIQSNLYKVTNKNSGYSMSIRGLDAVADAVLEQYPYSGDPDQQFEVFKVNDNFVLKPKGSKLVVATKNQGTAKGTTIVLAAEKATLLEQWILIPVPQN